ncbi:TVP38/TMEM64 family protein [Archangium lansingense]|uniref:TVP38/TMEM64 family membrane protein n=1 Tax=Archangium lansingense TaxID=2995310 RepID=A0ABT4A008_9BACT|nr:VTT domain-containing protein [Archangium lansinium]MCY1074988.1 VTT domain-containing protein [Archangium lansinium]
MRRSTMTQGHQPGWLSTEWKRVLLLLLLLGGLVLFASSEPFQSSLTWLLTKAEPVIKAHPFWGAALFVLLSAFSAMMAFFSSAVLVPVAVHTWGEPLCVVLLWCGWMLGGICAYGIARSWGRPVVRRLVSGELLGRYEERISQHSSFGLVLLFQLAVPSEIPGYVLGLARYGLRRYLLVLAVAELPYAVGTIYLGSSLLAQRTFVLLGLGALGILFSAWALHTLRKRLGS